jgi:hypothetical protein
MRLVEVVQVLAALVGAFASLAIGFEQKLLSTLKKQNASSPESAARLPEPRALSKWRLSVLLKHGAVRRTEDGLLYFDVGGYRLMRRRRISIAIPATLVAVAVVVLLAALS